MIHDENRRSGLYFPPSLFFPLSYLSHRVCSPLLLKTHLNREWTWFPNGYHKRKKLEWKKKMWNERGKGTDLHPQIFFSFQEAGSELAWLLLSFPQILSFYLFSCLFFWYQKSKVTTRVERVWLVHVSTSYNLHPIRTEIQTRRPSCCHRYSLLFLSLSLSFIKSSFIREMTIQVWMKAKERKERKWILVNKMRERERERGNGRSRERSMTDVSRFELLTWTRTKSSGNGIFDPWMDRHHKLSLSLSLLKQRIEKLLFFWSRVSGNFQREKEETNERGNKKPRLGLVNQKKTNGKYSLPSFSMSFERYKSPISLAPQSLLHSLSLSLSLFPSLNSLQTKDPHFWFRLTYYCYTFLEHTTILMHHLFPFFFVYPFISIKTRDTRSGPMDRGWEIERGCDRESSGEIERGIERERETDRVSQRDRERERDRER